MSGFSPFDILVTQAKVFNIFWQISVDVLDEHRKHREAELQKLLLETIGDRKDTNVSKRILPRIDRISAATRTFLDHNRVLTSLSSNPIIQKFELNMLREFVLLFQKMEREVRHTISDISLAKWRDENFRNELSQMASDDDTVYMMLVVAKMLSTSGRKHIAEQISDQLMCGHKHKKASYEQMA